jgi:hypothetical protein
MPLALFLSLGYVHVEEEWNAFPMNRQELREKLRKEGIRDDSYDLSGGHLSEALTLAEVYGRWFVYYSEKGLESGKKEFAIETEACEYLLKKLKSDPTAHIARGNTEN